MSDGRFKKFLELVPNANWRHPPPIWQPQLREALSGGHVKIGWGGRLELTAEGRAALADGDAK